MQLEFFDIMSETLQVKKSSLSLLFYLKHTLHVNYVFSKYDALDGADAMLLITEWKEFRSPDFEEMAKRLKNKIIFDGRNQYKQSKLEASGFEYFQIGGEVDCEQNFWNSKTTLVL